MDDRKTVLRAKKKRKRTVITPDEVDVLESAFRIQSRPDRYAKIKLAKDLGKTENFISIWFQNRRARERRQSHPPARDDVRHTSRRDGNTCRTFSLTDEQEEPLDLSDKSPRPLLTLASPKSKVNLHNRIE